MKEKMIIIYSNYGSSYSKIYRHVCDANISLTNRRGHPLTLCWATDCYGKELSNWHHLKADESFQIWDYNKSAYNRISKKII